MPWHKPWRIPVPVNPIRSNPIGTSTFLLALHGYGLPYWLTYLPSAGAWQKTAILIDNGKWPSLSCDKVATMTRAAADEQPFRHYGAKHRLVAWISQHLFDDLTYTVQHGLNKGMKRKGGLGWLPEFLTSSAKTPEEVFWSNLNLRDMVVYDVGAFEGLLTLYFARQARTVISYEPNIRNHAHLIQNLQVNRVKNVIVRKLGVGSETCRAVMAASPLMLGGASIESNAVEGLRNSNLPIILEEISVVRLDDDIRDASLPAPDFIKFDIEGLELAALKGAHQTIQVCRPQLFLEIHGETMNLKRKNVREIVAYLEKLGYGNIQHVETGKPINSAAASDAARGHIHCVP